MLAFLILASLCDLASLSSSFDSTIAADSLQLNFVEIALSCKVSFFLQDFYPFEKHILWQNCFLKKLSFLRNNINFLKNLFAGKPDLKLQISNPE